MREPERLVVLKAQGGRPDYTWTMSDASLGTLATANETAIYTSYGAPGQNFVTVHDTDSHALTATTTPL